MINTPQKLLGYVRSIYILLATGAILYLLWERQNTDPSPLVREKAAIDLRFEKLQKDMKELRLMHEVVIDSLKREVQRGHTEMETSLNEAEAEMDRMIRRLGVGDTLTAAEKDSIFMVLWERTRENENLFEQE